MKRLALILLSIGLATLFGEEAAVKMYPFVLSAPKMPGTTGEAIAIVEAEAKEWQVSLPPKDATSVLSFVVVYKPFSMHPVDFALSGTIEKLGADGFPTGGKVTITRRVPQRTQQELKLQPDQAATVLRWFTASKFLDPDTKPGGDDVFDPSWLYIELIYADRKLAFVRSGNEPDAGLFSAQIRPFELWSRPGADLKN